MQISANNLLTLQQAMGVRPRAEIKPPQPDAFEALFEKPAAQASPASGAQPSLTASAQPSAPAQMGSQLDIRV
jgi:hypothetical protein